jgi:hypothetical protein
MSNQLTRGVLRLGVLLCAGSAACSLSLGPDAVLAVDVQTAPIRRDTLGRALFTYTARNISGKTVYLPRCGADVEADVEVLFGDQWIGGQGVSGCFSSLALGPLPLSPGETVNAPVTGTFVPGTYRLRVLSATRADTDVDQFALSAAFRID